MELRPIDEYIVEAVRQITDMKNECMRLNVDLAKKYQ